MRPQLPSDRSHSAEPLPSTAFQKSSASEDVDPPDMSTLPSMEEFMQKLEQLAQYVNDLLQKRDRY